MTITQMAAGLAEWARPIGYGYRVESDDDVVLADGGGETRWYIRHRSGRILIETGQGSGKPHLKMATNSLLDAERYLTFSRGTVLRSVRFSRPWMIRMPIYLASVSDEFTIVQAPDPILQAIVLETGAERARFQRISPPYDAVQFTHYANIPISDLRASLLSASGRPSLSAYVRDR